MNLELYSIKNNLNLVVNRIGKLVFLLEVNQEMTYDYKYRKNVLKTMFYHKTMKLDKFNNLEKEAYEFDKSMDNVIQKYNKFIALLEDDINEVRLSETKNKINDVKVHIQNTKNSLNKMESSLEFCTDNQVANKKKSIKELNKHLKRLEKTKNGRIKKIENLNNQIKEYKETIEYLNKLDKNTESAYAKLINYLNSEEK